VRAGGLHVDDDTVHYYKGGLDRWVSGFESLTGCIYTPTEILRGFFAPPKHETSKPSFSDIWRHLLSSLQEGEKHGCPSPLPPLPRSLSLRDAAYGAVVQVLALGALALGSYQTRPQCTPSTRSKRSKAGGDDGRGVVDQRVGVDQHVVGDGQALRPCARTWPGAPHPAASRAAHRTGDRGLRHLACTCPCALAP
jgi:hypothetical protein